MGLPIAKIKDPSKSFPIKPLSIYVLANKKQQTQEMIFYSLVNCPPYSLLPIDYYFISTNSRILKQKNIMDDLSKYSIITRDVEIEECFESNSSCFPDDYCIEYMCGKVDWKLSFGFEMAVSILTHNLLENIRSFANKVLLFHRRIQENDEFRKKEDPFLKITSICDDSLKILAGKSKKNLKPFIEDFRMWLNETTIMRSSPKVFTNSMIRSSFEKGRILHSDYSIKVKRKDRNNNLYLIYLQIGDKEPLSIETREQCVFIYLFAIAFAYRGDNLSRDQLIYGTNRDNEAGPVLPAQRRTLTLLNYCYGALKGLNSESLKDLLERIPDTRFSPEFVEFYNKLSHDTHGNFDNQKLTNLLSRLNNRIIAERLKDYPDEVKRIFYLNYDSQNQLYSLNIAKENIIIE